MRELVVPGAPEHFDYPGSDGARRRIQSAWDGPGGGAAIQSVAGVLPCSGHAETFFDSDIKIEVWLPAAAWNGKFQAVGNGGWAGTISYGALASALQEGYATASTDTGHVGGNASFAVGHPEKVVDFAYRAVHGWR